MNWKNGIVLVLLMVLSACGGDKNALPEVNAGLDQTVEEGQVVEFNGNASDADGDIIATKWTQISGTQVDLSGANTLAPSFESPFLLASETLIFELSATDNDNGVSTDTVGITIEHENLLPSLIVPDSIRAIENSEIVATVHATDTDGQITSVNWSSDSDLNIIIEPDDTGLSASVFVPLVESDERIQISVVATDDSGAQASASFDINIVDDSVAPTNIVAIAATALSTSEIQLEWLESQDNITASSDLKYFAHLSNISGFIPDQTTVIQELGRDLVEIITELDSGNQYFFVIEARDNSGNSSFSNQVNAQTFSVEIEENEEQAKQVVAPIEINEDQIVIPVNDESQLPVEGEVIISAEGSGLLRKVVSVDVNGDIASVRTESATITDVLNEVEVDTRVKLIDVPEVSAANKRRAKSAGSVQLRSREVQNSMVNELSWKKGGLTLIDKQPLNQSRKTRKHRNKSAKSNQSDEVTKSYDNFSVTGLEAALLKPNISHNLEYKLEINTGVENHQVKSLSLKSIHHSGIDSRSEQYGINISAVVVPDDNIATLKLIWTPTDYHVDIEEHRPYELEIEATVVHDECLLDGVAGYQCTKTESFFTKVYVGSPDLPSLNNQSFAFSEGGLTLTGGMDFLFEPTIDVNAVVSGGRLQSAHAIIKGYSDFTTRISLNAQAAAQLRDQKVKLADKGFVRVIQAGAVPIVVRGEFVMNAVFDAEVFGQIDTSAEYKFTLDMAAGFERNNGEWSAVREFTPTQKFNLRGEAEVSAFAQVRLVPELKLWFYEAATTHAKIEPYLYSQFGLEGYFNSDLLSNGLDFDADYRFTGMEVGLGMDFKIRAGLQGWSDETDLLGWPSRDVNEFATFNIIGEEDENGAVIGGLPVLGLPVVSTDFIGLHKPINSCQFFARADVSPIQNPLRSLLGVESATLNDWIMDSSNWRAIPELEGDVLEFLHDSTFSTVGFFSKNMRSYTLRYFGNSEFGAWARQYSDVEIDLSDLDEDGMPDLWEQLYGVSEPDNDLDNDGLNNLLEWQNCAFPDSADSNLDGILDGQAYESDVAVSLDPTDKGALEDQGVNDQFVNLPPIVDAGDDTSISAQSETIEFQLQGTAEDSDGEVVEYHWKQIQGPYVGFSPNANVPNPTIKLRGVNEDKILQFRLTVRDDKGGESTAVVGVNVFASPENLYSEDDVVLFNGKTSRFGRELQAEQVDSQTIRVRVVHSNVGSDNLYNISIVGKKYGGTQYLGEIMVNELTQTSEWLEIDLSGISIHPGYGYARSSPFGFHLYARSREYGRRLQYISIIPASTFNFDVLRTHSDYSIHTSRQSESVTRVQNVLRIIALNYRQGKFSSEGLSTFLGEEYKNPQFGCHYKKSRCHIRYDLPTDRFKYGEQFITRVTRDFKNISFSLDVVTEVQEVKGKQNVFMGELNTGLPIDILEPESSYSPLEHHPRTLHMILYDSKHNWPQENLNLEIERISGNTINISKVREHVGGTNNRTVKSVYLGVDYSGEKIQYPALSDENVFSFKAVNDNGYVVSETTHTYNLIRKNYPPEFRNFEHEETVPEQTVVTLSSLAIDPDGTNVSYQWEGPRGLEIDNANTLNASFESPYVVGESITLAFTVTATDQENTITTARKRVIVYPVNSAPNIDDIESPQEVDEQISVSMSVQASDSDGFIESYFWEQIDGDLVSISNANQSTASFTAPTTTETLTLTFQLTVTDNEGGTDTNLVAVTVNPVNAAPTANAGADQSVNEQTTVSLSGSGSDTDGSITSYTWSQTSGTSVTLGNANQSTASFTAPTTTETLTLTFQLTVTDNEGGTDTNLVAVTVNPVNAAPTANAGADQTVNEQTTVILVGSGTDIDGSIADYAWSQASGETVSLSSVNQARVGFTAPVTTETLRLTFRLTVTDNEGGTDSSLVAVTVNPVNAAPTANAGAEQSVNEQTTVSLSGSGSDTDGSITSYAWSQTSGTSVTLSNANQSTASFTAPTTTETLPLTFQLTVTDNEGGTDTNLVAVTVNPVNAAPTANAGADQSVNEQTTVMLSGSGSDTDGSITSYAWSQTSGTSVTLGNANQSTANFTAPTTTETLTLTFQLTVTDNEGGTDTNLVAVTVNPVNAAPTANAGADQSVNEQTTVMLSGSGSDTDGSITSYAWSQTSGTSVTLGNANQSTASFTAPTTTETLTLTFQLTVTDNEGGTDTNLVAVTVNPVNAAPTANAGADQSVNEQTTVMLSGSGSDTDGSITSYAWSQTSGTSVTLGNANQSTASFTAPTTTETLPLTFQLTVTDNEGGTDTNLVAVTVNPVNAAPTANAGADQSVNEQTTVMLSGSGSDTDGSITSYAWSQTSGTSVTLGNANQSTANFTAPTTTETLPLTFQLTVTDNEGGTDTNLVAVTVNPVNAAPTANAGADQSVNEQTTVMLSGSGSDTDGSITSYVWSQTSGTSVTLSNANQATASFTAPATTETLTLTFQLTVTDNEGGMEMDTVNILVSSIEPLITWSQFYPFELTPRALETNQAAYATSFVHADLNGDGAVDIITVNVEGYLVFYKFDGEEDFIQHILDDDIGWTKSLDAKDMDGDGDIDILFTNVSSGKWFIYQNEGSMSFNKLEFSHDLTFSKKIVAEDLDTDGDIDVLISSSNTNELLFFENLGDMTFTGEQLQIQDYISNVLRTVAVRDLDSDGDPDVILGGSDEVAWLENDGFGTLTPQTIDDTIGAVALSVGNIDNDLNSTLDILVGDIGSAYVLLNLGGEFSKISLSENIYILSTSIADLQLDGRNELITSRYYAGSFAGQLKIFSVDSNLAFEESKNVDLTELITVMSSNDFDNDGDVDIFASHNEFEAGMFPLTVFEHVSSDRFTVESDTNLVGVTLAVDKSGSDISYTITGGDDAQFFRIDTEAALVEFIQAPNHDEPLDSDGDNIYSIEISATSENGVISTEVFVEVTPGNQAPIANAGVDQVVEVNSSVLLDGTDSYDTDGSISSYSWSQSSGTTVVLSDANSEDPTFPAPTVTSSDSLVFDLMVTDNEGAVATDSVTIIVNPVNNPPVWTQFYGGGFSISTIDSSSNGILEHLHIVDIDNDEDLDIVGTRSQRIRIYENMGDNNFSDSTVYSGTFSSDGIMSGIDSGDVDSDGDIDLIVTSNFSAQVNWYENTGGLNFVKTNIPTTMSATSVPLVADFNGDGSMDIGVSSGGQSEYSIYTNDGIESFSENTIDTGGTGGRPVGAFVDLDNDTERDIVLAGISGVSWVRNDGSGDFTNPVINYLGATSARDLIVSDFNNDGHKDIVTAWFDLYFFRNNGDTSFTRTQLPDDNSIWIKLAYADFDSDSDLDFASVSITTDRLTIFENDGTGEFTTNVISTEAGGATALSSGDLDGDGDIDLISSGIGNEDIPSQHHLTLYRNDQSDSFSVQSGTATVGTIAANDPENDPISYSVSGGSDSSLFQIDSISGSLTFVSVPDFNTPLDADNDNVYELQVSATANGDTISTDVRVKVLP